MTPSPRWQIDWRAGALVAAAALLVRLLHLAASASGPFFAEPVVDAMTYHDLARDLAAGGPLTDRLLWQAPFYPLLLAGLYAVVGPSVAAARILGAVIGAVTALVAWRLGARTLGPRSGLATGLIVVLHGVLVAFDTELLATGLATLWLALGVLLLVELRARASGRLAAVLALVVALALVTRTVAAFALLAGLIWTIARADWRPDHRGRVLAATAGVLIVVLAPYAAVMHHHTGHAGLWPPSGAINLHLGNNPDIDATLAIRPGLPWEALIAEPVRETGVNDPWRSATWFNTRTRAFLADQPVTFVANLARKAVHLVTTRELPRNVDVMALRPWSPVLTALLGRAGPWGWPTGLLLPLTAVGLALAWRRVPTVLLVTMAVYALALVLVFTSARYRAPLWPLAAVVAVGGAVALIDGIRARRWRPVAAACVVALATLLVGTVPGPHAQERLDLTGEMWHGVGFNQLRRDELAAAETSFRQAIAARDRYPEAWNRLGVELARQERYRESIPCFERALALAPDYPDPRANLDLARRRAAEQIFAEAHRAQQAGEDAAAARLFDEVLALRPRWAEPRGRLAQILATTAVDSLRDPARAVTLAKQALADHGEDHPWLLEVLEDARAAADDDRPDRR